MAERKIFFRADAGVDIGYGHFIRSLALADMLKDNFDCYFFTQTPTVYQRKEVSQVCSLVALPSDESKFALFLSLLHGDEIVVLDNYFFTTDYQQRIKEKGCKLVCIDDVHDKHYVADVVINHGNDYSSLFDIEPYTRLCLGLRWSLLRRPFLEIHKSLIREKGHVVVSFGGSDVDNFTTKIAKFLSSIPSVDIITAIVGDSFHYDDELIQVEKVKLQRNLSAEQMSDLFRVVEYSVLSASTTSIEALACGCPIFVGWYIDNQLGMYNYLQSTGYVIGIGNLFTFNAHDFAGTHLILPNQNEQAFVQIREHYVDLFTRL